MKMLKTIIIGLSLAVAIVPQAQAMSYLHDVRSTVKDIYSIISIGLQLAYNKAQAFQEIENFDMILEEGDVSLASLSEGSCEKLNAEDKAREQEMLVAKQKEQEMLVAKQKEQEMLVAKQKKEEALSTIVQYIQSDLNCGCTSFIKNYQQSVSEVFDKLNDPQIKEELLAKINEVYKKLNAYYASFSLTANAQEKFFEKLNQSVADFNKVMRTLNGDFVVTAYRIDKTKLVGALVKDLHKVINGQLSEQNRIVQSFDDNASAQNLVKNIYTYVGSKNFVLAQQGIDRLCEQLKIKKIVDVFGDLVEQRTVYATYQTTNVMSEKTRNVITADALAKKVVAPEVKNSNAEISAHVEDAEEVKPATIGYFMSKYLAPCVCHKNNQ